MSRRIALTALCFCAVAGAAVKSVHVIERTDVLNGQPMGAAGPYERIVARVTFTVDPKLPANRIISDIDFAPRNDDALVEFSADLYVLKPRDPRTGNGTALFEVSNRGRKGVLGMFNLGGASLDPREERDFGDRFLLERGFTLVWLGWQADVPRQPELMRLHAPVATQNGRAITGIVRAEFVPDAKIFSHTLADRTHIPYAVINPDDPAVRLTVRDRCDAERRVIPRSQWSFARFENGKPIPDLTAVYMAAGFEPGKVYEVVYQSKDPVLAGLGPTAIRDFISFLKYGGPRASLSVLGDQSRFIKRAIGFGTSQSGRFLRTFLYYGFNRDEGNRRVFDGVWSHVAGAGRGSFNHRFAQPSRDGHPHMNCQFPTDIYPFSDLAQKDATTGLDEGLLSRALADNVAPKIMYTNSSYEYWGRSASLVHTSIDGRQDFGTGKDTRVYMFAGSQHGPGAFPPQKANGQNHNNANDYRWPMRALLVSFQDWLVSGKEPPPSAHPLVGKDQLVAPSALAFPKAPGIALPARQQKAYRADYGSEFRTTGVVTREPPTLGAAFPTLVPQVDSDGNETSGIRLPVIAAPLATYTGWNLRRPDLGASAELFSMVGSTIPFARTAAERKKTGDPRLSIEERYRSRADYLEKFESAARELVRSGYVLESDVARIVARGASMWDAWAGGGQ